MRDRETMRPLEAAHRRYRRSELRDDRHERERRNAPRALDAPASWRCCSSRRGWSWPRAGPLPSTSTRLRRRLRPSSRLRRRGRPTGRCPPRREPAPENARAAFTPEDALRLLDELRREPASPVTIKSVTEAGVSSHDGSALRGGAEPRPLPRRDVSIPPLGASSPPRGAAEPDRASPRGVR